MTQVWTKESIQQLIKTNDAAVARAILALYARQTDAERSTAHTSVENGIGFNKIDAPFLTSIAKALPRYNMHMTPRQLATARKMLPKYWRQLLQVAGEKGAAVMEITSKRAAVPAYSDNPNYARF